MSLGEARGYHYCPSPVVLPVPDCQGYADFSERWVSDRWHSHPVRERRDWDIYAASGIACACVGWPYCCRYAKEEREFELMRQRMEPRP